ncbi:thymidylate synthase, partial [Chryseobacterium sp. HMWF028]
MNKYHEILNEILCLGKLQDNNKGNIIYLLNKKLHLKPSDLLDIFEGHLIARKKLKTELDLFQSGERL